MFKVGDLVRVRSVLTGQMEKILPGLAGESLEVAEIESPETASIPGHPQVVVKCAGRLIGVNAGVNGIRPHRFSVVWFELAQ